MTKTSDEKSSKLKPYQMILLSCLLAAFMIINSNNVNYNRDLAKLNKEKGELFDRIIKTRRLSSTSSQTYSAEICARGSDDLKKYYPTVKPERYKPILDSLLSDIFDGKINNEKDELIKAIEGKLKYL